MLPADADEELSLRYQHFRRLSKRRQDTNSESRMAPNAKKAGLSCFGNLILRPFAEELSQWLGDAANLATPEARPYKLCLTEFQARKRARSF